MTPFELVASKEWESPGFKMKLTPPGNGTVRAVLILQFDSGTRDGEVCCMQKEINERLFIQGNAGIFSTFILKHFCHETHAFMNKALKAIQTNGPKP